MAGVLRLIARGWAPTATNPVTGTLRTQAELATKARGYMTDQIAEATFQQFLSIFEGFFFDLLRLWLVAYPRSLSARKVDFKDVLDRPDKDSIVAGGGR